MKSWQRGQKFPVIVGVGGTTCQASLLNSDSESDAAVLAFDEKLDVEPLPIANLLTRNVAWEGFGFPALSVKTARPGGLPIDGQVKDPQATNDIGQDAPR